MISIEALSYFPRYTKFYYATGTTKLVTFVLSGSCQCNAAHAHARTARTSFSHVESAT